jgi:hypothetical protein
MDQHKIEKVRGRKRVDPQDKSLTTIYLPYARIVGQCLSILVPIMGVDGRSWKCTLTIHHSSVAHLVL